MTAPPDHRKERILVTVKTYPTLSRSHAETVCTAGITEAGEWIRLYPVPFRRLEEKEQYRKFDWIDCEIQRNHKDKRPESYKPVNTSQLIPVGHLDTANHWSERRKLILETCKVYTRVDQLIEEAKENIASLAVFKPTEIVDFYWKPDDANWDSRKLEQAYRVLNTPTLFDQRTWDKTFKIVQKLPWNFFYKFNDETGRVTNMRILDWELGSLYWNCLKRADNDDEEALKKVKLKYWNEFKQTDLHLFLGTTKTYHSIAPNPWTIIGVFYIPHQTNFELFDRNDS